MEVMFRNEKRLERRKAPNANIKVDALVKSQN